MADCFSPYIPLIILMYTYPSAAMSPSISYRSLMSGGKYSECILVYSALDMGVSRKYFKSKDINLAPLRASKIVLLNSSFDSKIYAVDDDAASGYLSLSPPTVNLNRYGYYFGGGYHTQNWYM